ncbi:MULTISPECIES: sialate O-acetylesterase [unclassified Sphingobacterium]|uniref:sialate O-acetylesterase n=1 Tax=unclassified Sphingobacterium TaxID=2609468 RepID=UPI001050AE32|nr:MULTISPECIES: sialate O-acetylesterase [unclassified Sphingobacterium]MCS3554219.1 hypothetical protein [Sphingobacterium sp. JUb21]TCR08052.1 carbohydrate esterase-like sialic acid-specific acetylesterase [Sphingobacterium sp. JUb20]
MIRLYFAFSLTVTVILLLSCNAQKVRFSNVPDNKEKFHIFILMGQSNMAGYGSLQEGDTIAVPNVFKLPTLYSGQLKWEPAAHPLHNRLESDRFGLGLPFAQEYLADHKNIAVGLIPLAFGGAEIDQLKKGTSVYDDFLKKLIFAQQKGIIKGLLWHQGESDTVDELKAIGYEGKLIQLIEDVRHDVGDQNLSVVVGNLAEFYGTSSEHNMPERVKRIDRIKNTLRDLPKKIKKVAFVESTGTTSIDKHNVHFDRASYILLGKRYALAIDSLK